MRRALPRRVAAAAAAAAAAALPEGEGGQPVDVQDAGTGRVWRVTLGGGRLLALKLAVTGAPARVEATSRAEAQRPTRGGVVTEAPLGGELRTLRWLAQRGAPVPAVLAADGAPEPDWLALEWCGDRTLDDALQGAAAGGVPWGEGGKRLVRAVAAVEGAFWPISAGARRRPEWAQQVAALSSQAAPWLAAAPGALDWLLRVDGPTGGRGRGGEGGVAGALRRTVALVLGGEPDVGSLDYNARNVVLDESRERVTLVDFAATGVDWPERRLVQYATATGTTPGGAVPAAGAGPGAGAGAAPGAAPGGEQGGTFRSALTAEAVQEYGALVAPRRGVSQAAVVAAVDAHEVLLLLLAAVGLQAVEAGTAHPERARAWGDVAGRREALLALLRRPLSDAGPGAEVRAAARAAGRGPG